MDHQDAQRNYRIFNDQIHRLGERLKKVSIIGLQDVPVYDVFWFFIRGVQKGSINTRASSIAFNFLLATGPAIIFLITLIPYIPVNNLYSELISMIQEVMPTLAFEAIQKTVEGMTVKRGGLQIFGLLTTIFFSVKGIIAMIDAFNATYHTIEKRPTHVKYLTALLIMGVLIVLVSISLVLIVFGKTLIGFLIDRNILEINLQYYLLLTIKWIVVTALIFFSISFLFYLAPFKKTGYRFINAGSTLATILTIFASLGFSYFVNNFAQFNKFFGSIGALMALMIWMNFNSLTLLIGFELNASIDNAQLRFEPDDEIPV